MNLNPDLGSVLRTLTAAWPTVLRDSILTLGTRLFAHRYSVQVMRNFVLSLKTGMSRKLRQKIVLMSCGEEEYCMYCTCTKYIHNYL